MAKMGRPKIEFNESDWRTIEKLCSIQCTADEICGVLKESKGLRTLSIDTLYRACKETKKMTFAEYFKINSAAGKASLRRKQFEMAMRGDKTMLVFLGKQYLGQSDKVENTTTVIDNDIMKQVQEAVKKAESE